HRHRQHALCVGLSDHVVVEDGEDFLRCRHALARLHHRGLVLLADNVHAQFDALVADEYRRPGNQLADLVLALAAERAVEGILGVAATPRIADLAHVSRSFSRPSDQPAASSPAILLPESLYANIPIVGIPGSDNFPRRSSRTKHESENAATSERICTKIRPLKTQHRLNVGCHQTGGNSQL